MSTDSCLTIPTTCKNETCRRLYSQKDVQVIGNQIAVNFQRINCKKCAAIMGYGPGGRVVGVIQGLKMEIVLGYVYQTSEITFDLHATDLEYFDLEFDGHYYIDWILNLLGDILIVLLKGHILRSVEHAVKDASQEYVTAANRIIQDYKSTLLPLFFKKLLQAAATR